MHRLCPIGGEWPLQRLLRRRREERRERLEPRLEEAQFGRLVCHPQARHERPPALGLRLQRDRLDDLDLPPWRRHVRIVAPMPRTDIGVLPLRRSAELRTLRSGPERVGVKRGLVGNFSTVRSAPAPDVVGAAARDTRCVTTVTRPEPTCAPLGGLTVAAGMTSGLISCAPETPLRNVARLMATHRVHAIFVFDYGYEDDETTELWGLVSDLDVAAAACGDIDKWNARDSAVTPLVTVASDSTLERAGSTSRGRSHADERPQRERRGAGIARVEVTLALVRRTRRRARGDDRCRSRAWGRPCMRDPVRRVRFDRHLGRDRCGERLDDHCRRGQEAAAVADGRVSGLPSPAPILHLPVAVTVSIRLCAQRGAA